MIDFIMGPWPWWLSGGLIGLIVPLLFVSIGKGFGISSSLQHIGAICSPNSKIDYLGKHEWRRGIWNLVFIVGIAFGAFVAANFLSAEPVRLLPASSYSVVGVIRLLAGGVLVGFGTRYAGGCTSGHTITGISNFNLPSLVATIFFFMGGLALTWSLGSLIF